METGPMGADALLADACFVNESQTGPHLNVKEACALAQAAGVKTLYLTHLWGKYDTEAEVKEAIDFPSAVVVKERERYCI
jgi:ribonuclease BN (tRNA processing enzyme)